MAELPEILQQQDSAYISELIPEFPAITPIKPEPQGFFRNVYDSFYLNWFSQAAETHRDYLRPSSKPTYVPKVGSMVQNEPIPNDPSFNLENYLRADPRKIRWAHKFENVYSEAAANNVWNHIQTNLDAEERLANSEASISRMIGESLTPDVILPIGGIRRGVGLVEGVLRGVAVGLPTVVANEALKLKYNPTAQLDDAKENILYGTAMFGLLGGGVGFLRKGQSAGELGRLMAEETRDIVGRSTNDGVDIPLTRSVAQTEGDGFVPYIAKPTGDTPTGFASAFGLERIASRQSGWARAANFGVRAYEDLSNRFFGDGGVLFARNRQGIATEPSAFLAAEGWIAKAGDAILDIKNLHANYLTDGQVSSEIAGLNVRSSLSSLSDKVRKVTGKQRMDGKLRADEFERAVFDSYVAAQRSGLIDHPIPQVKEAALRLQKFFKEFADEGYAVNYFRSGNNEVFALRISRELDAVTREIEDLRKAGGETPLLKKLMKHESALKRELQLNQQAPMRSPIPFYFPHRWDVSAVIKEEPRLREILTRHFYKTAHDLGYSRIDEAVAARVDDAIDNILGRKKEGDDTVPKKLSGDGRAFFTRARQIDIPTELIKDFIDTDLLGVMREYSRKAGLGIEYTRAFDTPTGDLAINRASIQAAREGKSLSQIDSVEGDIINVRDALLGRAHSPEQIGSKEASILRSWFTLTSMGKAIFANMAEVARPLWVLGVKENFGYALRALGNNDVVASMNSELRQNTSGYWELALGMTHRRFIESGPDSFGSMSRYGRALDSVERPLSYFASAPYYLLNGVGVMTHFLKNYTGLVASEMILRRAINIANSSKVSFPIKTTNFSQSKTNNPFFVKLYRGEGGSQPKVVPILGDGRYTTPNKNYAETYGNVSEYEVYLEKPLVISNDSQFIELTKESGLKSPRDLLNTSLTEDELINLTNKLKKTIISKGHDGVIIKIPRFNGNQIDETIGTLLTKIFDEDQVIEFFPKDFKPSGIINKKDLEFLASYGIGREDAIKIASMPINRDRGLILANTNEWTDKDAVRKFFGAVEGIQRRTINTPSAADKPTIMMGILGKGADRKESIMMALPFQLKAWSFGANNKIVLSALQGRDASVMAGALGMFGLAYMANYIKTPTGVWNRQDFDEKLLTAFETSGIAALYGDLNFMAEQASQDTIGIRPMTGMKPKFGQEADVYDAAGEVAGPAISKMLDIYKAFNNGTPRDKARVTVNAIPLNNLFWIPESFRAMSRKTLEEVYQ